MQHIAVRNRALETTLRTYLAGLDDLMSAGDPVAKQHSVDVVNSDAPVHIQDFCAIRYQLQCRIITGKAAISLSIGFPAELGLDIDAVLSDLAPVLAAASLSAQPTGPSAVTLRWELDLGVRNGNRDALGVLAHIRYHALACGLRRHFQRAGNARSAALSLIARVHHLHPRLAVLAVERDLDVLVVVPLRARDAASSAYLQNLVNGFTQQPHRSGPRCAFWEAKCPPGELRPFPALCAAGTAGFLTFTIPRPREPSDPTLEQALHCLVFFQDFVDAAMLSCKLLTKARMRAQFASYQRKFDANRAQPQQI